MPNGLNADEASAGYDAYSLLNYGLDRNGKTLPVHFISWGSGQNALYLYLIIPFIKFLGLTVFSVRLPMAIIGCISLVLMYLILRKVENNKLATVGLIFFAICPWHIMKSRWGLESNLFPDIILLAVTCLIYGLQNNKKVLFYLSFVLIGLSAYSYGTSYFFLPFFLGTLLIYLILNKKINVKQAILGLAISVIIATPLIIFLIINKFNLPEINIGIITIPRLTADRFDGLSSVFSSDFIKVSFNNFKQSLDILITQYDNLPWNGIRNFGIIYSFSMIFTIVGIAYSFKRNKNENKLISGIFNIWFIISVLLLYVCEPNINRMNIIIIPIIYYTIIGIYQIIQKSRIVLISVLVLYILAFGLFIDKYVSTEMTFEKGLQEVIEYVSKLDNEKIYITDKIKAPYIYTLFYEKTNVNEFLDSVQYKTTDGIYNDVVSFKNYYFYLPKTIDIQEDNVYVIRQDENVQLDKTIFKQTKINQYIIIEKIK